LPDAVLARIGIYQICSHGCHLFFSSNTHGGTIVTSNFVSMPAFPGLSPHPASLLAFGAQDAPEDVDKYQWEYGSKGKRDQNR
jgi:hypothetical protein